MPIRVPRLSSRIGMIISKRLRNNLEIKILQISNCSHYTENMSSLLDFYLQPLTWEVKSYIKDTNDNLKKLRSLRNLHDDITLCTADVAGLYPNISHDEDLSILLKGLDLRQEKDVTTSTLVELAEVVTSMQKQGTAVPVWYKICSTV